MQAAHQLAGPRVPIRTVLEPRFQCTACLVDMLSPPTRRRRQAGFAVCMRLVSQVRAMEELMETREWQQMAPAERQERESTHRTNCGSPQLCHHRLLWRLRSP